MGDTIWACLRVFVYVYKCMCACLCVCLSVCLILSISPFSHQYTCKLYIFLCTCLLWCVWFHHSDSVCIFTSLSTCVSSRACHCLSTPFSVFLCLRPYIPVSQVRLSIDTWTRRARSLAPAFYQAMYGNGLAPRSWRLTPSYALCNICRIIGYSDTTRFRFDFRACIRLLSAASQPSFCRKVRAADHCGDSYNNYREEMGDTICWLHLVLLEAKMRNYWLIRSSLRCIFSSICCSKKALLAMRTDVEPCPLFKGKGIQNVYSAHVASTLWGSDLSPPLVRLNGPLPVQRTVLARNLNLRY